MADSNTGHSLRPLAFARLEKFSGVSTPSGVKEECRLREGGFRSVSQTSPSARELIRRGRRGVGAAESGHAKPHAGPQAALGSRTQACTQVRTRLRRPARRPARGRAKPQADPNAATQDRTQPWSGPWRLPGAARAGEASPRLWKLTGCGKLRATATRPRTFPQPLEIPASIHRPGIPTATPSLGDEEPERKKRKKKTANRYFSIFPSLGTRRTTPLPATRASSAAAG